MRIDLAATATFLRTHARLLDQQRFLLLTGQGSADAVLAAVAAYRNPDGGFGWGLEPDLRAPESQPSAALHAFEVFAETGPTTTPMAAALCDWLDTVTLPDGGLPFALPTSEPAGSAPFWVNADPTASSLQITAVVTTYALRVARHDPAVRDHPWLARATKYCWDRATALTGLSFALEFRYVLWFLDALTDVRSEAHDELRRLGAFLPADGRLPVAGGSADEALHPLDISPAPDRPLRQLFDPAVVAADLDRLRGLRQDDGGWVVDFASYSPAAALEWRGYATVAAVTTLLAQEAADAAGR